MRAEIEVTEVRSSASEIDAFLAEIPEGDTLLVIDTTAPPLGHETLSLRPNNLTRAFERAGMWVVFLPFSSLQEFPARVSDRVLQVARKDFGRLVRGLTTRRRSMGDTYICSSFPSIAAVALGTQLKTLGWQVVYECRDDMEEFNRVGYSKWYSPALERQMLIVADKVVSVSTALDAKLVSMWPALRDHAVIPNAVNRHVIDQSEGLRTEESFDRREHLRVAGYVGHLTPSWFDWPLIAEAARRMPETVFEIIGHGAPQGMSLPSNVHLLGPRSPSSWRTSSPAGRSGSSRSWTSRSPDRSTRTRSTSTSHGVCGVSPRPWGVWRRIRRPGSIGEWTSSWRNSTRH